MLSSYNLLNVVESLLFAPIVLSSTGEPINCNDEADNAVLDSGISVQHFLDYVAVPKLTTALM